MFAVIGFCILVLMICFWKTTLVLFTCIYIADKIPAKKSIYHNIPDEVLLSRMKRNEAILRNRAAINEMTKAYKA
jgi:hypothetical protein